GDGAQDDPRGRRGGAAVLARVSLRRRLREAGGGRLSGRAGAPAAGGPEEPLRRAAVGPRLREGRPHEGSEGGLPEGARLTVGRHRAAARVQRGQEEGLRAVGVFYFRGDPLLIRTERGPL